MSFKRLIPTLAALFLMIAACSQAPDESPADLVDEIAAKFVHEYFTQFPEEVYEVGYGGAPLNRFGDHSEASTAAWDARVDGWLSSLNAVDVTALTSTADTVTYVFTRDTLQSLVDRRVCQNDLWNISPTWTGWQFMFASTLAIQPVATADERQAAIERIIDAARYLNTDVSNLRRGLDQGFLAPQSNVVAVIEQVTSLIETDAAESPFYSPAARSSDEAFVAAYADAYDTTLKPALIAYRDFLADDYEGRETPGVGANPNGEACYAASVRFWSSLSITADDIHRAGLSDLLV